MRVLKDCFVPVARTGSVILLLCFLMFFFYGCQERAGRENALSPPLPGGELFRSKCGKCHDLDRALEKSRSKEVWYDTINRMKKEHGAKLTRADIEELVNYHVARQEKEAELFKEKCEKCHPGKLFLEKKLSGEQAREIIKRMQQKAGNNISDQDVEIIVRYHVRAQKEAVQRNLRAVYYQVLDKTDQKSDAELFKKKCTECHDLDRALSLIKDPLAWEETIRRMQSYSKGAITDRDVREMVRFHVSVQRREIDTFRQTCTRCHDDSRINSRSMSDDQWLATIKRMQKKAPELITDEKVDVIAAYFHRRELTLARIFYGKCRLCHSNNPEAILMTAGVPRQLDGLIAMAKQEFGGSLQIGDVNNLLSVHVQRQKRNLRLYESNCTKCHLSGPPDKEKTGREAVPERSRAEWISFIAVLRGEELTKDLQTNIDSQIDFHVARQQS